MPVRPALLIAALLLTSPLAWAEAPPAPTLPKPEHPLAGHIWVPAGGYFISADEVARRAQAADALLLGETHDNVDHHALQAWLLGRFIAAGKRPLLAFEMMDVGQNAALTSHLANRPGDAAGIGAAIGWDKSGWPDWALYRPLAETALHAGAPLAAASLTRDDTRAIAKGTPPDALVGPLGLDKPVPDELRRAMEDEIKASHCDMLPDKALPAMVRVQRARDAFMARTLANGIAAEGSAVLIAGSGHVRTDRAVPAFLAEMAPGRPVFAVAFLEVQEDKPDPAAYGEIHDSPRPPFDAIWFTARFDREDQCEGLKKHLEKKAG